MIPPEPLQVEVKEAGIDHRPRSDAGDGPADYSSGREPEIHCTDLERYLYNDIHELRNLGYPYFTTPIHTG